MKKIKSRIDKDLKRELIFAAVIFTVITGILLKTYTGFLGAPDLVYLSECNNKIWNWYIPPDDVYEVSVDDNYKDQKAAEYALKYCNNVTDLRITGDYDDWSMLSGLRNVERISFHNTNFNDVSLLFSSGQLKSLIFCCDDTSKEFNCVSSYKDLQPFKDLSYFGVRGYCIDIDLLETINQFDNNVSVYIAGGKYNGDIEPAQTILESLSSKGWHVQIKDSGIDITSEDP
ncbi:MAG: hypothetical protein Q4F95_09045 [Oscillospiraceae bacterium]|nr:hypothetical protein [Oscillospiraceae bacterium]